MTHRLRTCKRIARVMERLSRALQRRIDGDGLYGRAKR